MSDDTPPFSLESELLPTIAGQRIGSSNRITLLENIDALGSISQAARAVPMSYKAAWDAIDAMNNLAPEPLVVRQTGGKGGGASRLTPFGKTLVAQYRAWEALHQEVMAKLRQTTPLLSGNPVRHFTLWQRLDMHFSAGNQLFGIISDIRTGAVNNEIYLRLANGLTIVGIITQESTAVMNLRVGMEAFALIQASSIIIAEPLHGVQVSARNQISARIQRLHQGSVNTEVICAIGDHLSLSATVTCASAEAMQLAEGKAITLLIKAPSVIFGRIE